jgi:hypothetical protein
MTDDGWEWAAVEIFGHRCHAGRIREEERFGVKMLRIDVPVNGDPQKHGWKTHWYGGASIFSLVLTDEASAMVANKPYDAPALHRLPYRPGAEEEEDAGMSDDYGVRATLSPAERIQAAADRAEARSRLAASKGGGEPPF